MSFEHQDWDNVVFKKAPNKKKGQTQGLTRRIPRRQANQTASGHGIMGTTARNGKTLDKETETFKVKKVPLVISLAIQQGRAKAGMTQKKLAQLLNVKPTTIQSYENGKAIPSGKIIQRIEKCLGMEYGSISGKSRKKKKTS